MKLFALSTLLLLMSSCLQKPKDSFSKDFALMQPGDIVITSYIGDSAILLDSDGNFKQLLYNPPNNIDAVHGASWNPITKEIMLSINGTPDRIVAVSAYDGSVRDAVRHNGLNGNTYGIAVNSDGDFWAIESNSVEKFTADGFRVSNTDFPSANILNGLAQINPLQAGGFVACGTNSDRARTFGDDGNQVNDSGGSGIGGTTNAYGCVQLPNGNIAVSWEGSNDTIRIYDSTLNTTIIDFNDTGVLSSPRNLAVKANGNILVADLGYHWIVEIDQSGNLIRTFGSGLFAYPWGIAVIPEY